MRTIEQIDQAIDSNRRALMARVHCSPECSARAWQNAWDRCPDLRKLDFELFRERGEAQEVADREENRRYQALGRAERARLRKAA